MKPAIYWCILLVMSSVGSLKGQSTGLDTLKSHPLKVLYSDGHTQRAAAIADRVNKAMIYFQQLLAFKPDFTVLVLSENDWKKHANQSLVYGMPHYESKMLVVAAEDNPFWRSFLPPLGQLPKELKESIQMVYTNSNGNISMESFFDLLAIHELGHIFHSEGGLKMQRKWMAELFVNILLHTYVAEKEPEALPALTLFPRMVVSGGAKQFKYTSLPDIEQHYDEIGSKYPMNYGWYQCRWHAGAGKIYDSAGEEVGRKLWDALRSNKETLTDEQLIIFLSQSAHSSIADLVANWDKDTVIEPASK
jgi:hypothetical protein